MHSFRKNSTFFESHCIHTLWIVESVVVLCVWWFSNVQDGKSLDAPGGCTRRKKQTHVYVHEGKTNTGVYIRSKTNRICMYTKENQHKYITRQKEYTTNNTRTTNTQHVERLSLQDK
eukprot:GHVS01009677.1.p1 GENE.GHVS01009677.1~~GHVS01009677.1.p1  ORF type:complete len:117 (-),score=10.22 GHVS01009677.1:74-424(-)